MLYFYCFGMRIMLFISYISGKAKATDKISIIDAKRLVMYGGIFFSKGFIGVIWKKKKNNSIIFFFKKKRSRGTGFFLWYKGELNLNVCNREGGEVKVKLFLKISKSNEKEKSLQRSWIHSLLNFKEPLKLVNRSL